MEWTHVHMQSLWLIRLTKHCIWTASKLQKRVVTSNKTSYTNFTRKTHTTWIEVKKQSTTNNIDGTRSHYTLFLLPVRSFVLNGNRWKINSISQHFFQLLKFIISSLNVLDGFDNAQYGYRMTSTHRCRYVANSKLWINGKNICWLKANRNELSNPKNWYLFKKIVTKLHKNIK